MSAVTSVGDTLESLLNQAAAALLEGRFRQASEMFTECMRENPDSSDACLGRGRCAAGMGEHEKALEDFNTALELDQNSAEALCARALSQAALDNHSAAMADLNECLRLRPDFADAYCARAAEHLREGRAENALEDATEAICLNPDLAEGYYQRHLAYADLGRVELATEDYAEARTLGCTKEKSGRLLQTVRAPVEPSPPEGESESRPVTAHVLFMDVVRSTHLTADGQRRTNARLTEIVVGTREYRSAVALDQVIALDAGDAIALAFLQNLEAPLMCAVEIARRLQADPFCELRMGIHSGVVFLRTDISGKRNVTGPGINLAERVMSCGGGGHILVSGKAADDLRHLSAWRGKLRYLGEYSAKDDWVQVWSYLDGVIGNAAPLERTPRQSA